MYIGNIVKRMDLQRERKGDECIKENGQIIGVPPWHELHPTPTLNGTTSQEAIQK
jgi:hypothetical protein